MSWIVWPTLHHPSRTGEEKAQSWYRGNQGKDIVTIVSGLELTSSTTVQHPRSTHLLGPLDLAVRSYSLRFRISASAVAYTHWQAGQWAASGRSCIHDRRACELRATSGPNVSARARRQEQSGAGGLGPSLRYLSKQGWHIGDQRSP